MKLSTSKLIQHLRELVSNDKVYKAINILINITTDKYDFYDDLLLIKKRYKNLHKKEMSGLGDEHDTRNRITRDFLKLLTSIKNNNSRGIKIPKSNYILTNLEDAILPSQQRKSKVKTKKKTSSKDKKVNTKYLIIIFVISFIVLVSFFIPNNEKSKNTPFSKTNIENSNTKKIEPYWKILADRLNESEKNEKVWAINLAAYKTYEEAYKQAVVYKARKISVFKKDTNNDSSIYYALIFPFKSEEAAKKKLTRTTKSTWSNAEIIQIDNTCNNMRINKELNCIECL